MASEATVTNAADLADKWGQKLADIVSKHGPDAAELALAVARVGAIKTVVIGIVLVGLSVTGFRVALGLYRSALGIVADGGDRYRNDEEVPRFVGAALLCVVSAFLLVPGFIQLLDVYAWAGIFRPEIFLAAKALNF